MDVLLLGQLASAFGALAQNPAFGGKSADVGRMAGLVGLALTSGVMGDADRRQLLAQVHEANAAGRGLTDVQLQAWRGRHLLAKAAIEGWRAQ